MKKATNKIISIIALLISAYFANNYVQESSNNFSTKQNVINNEKLESLFRKHQSNKIITIDAKVINILSDDRQGDKHQRLIIKSGNITLLLAHNIDIASRVPVKKGDLINVRGEYEWNEKGGVIHWTHKSDSNRHESGWIKHNKKKYN